MHLLPVTKLIKAKKISDYENIVIFNKNIFVSVYIHIVSCLLVIFILSQLYENNLENL